ncbi:MAG: penicillin acylase family protein [Planctomycetes bacterium]|nr:penicillin acylase family protein [Planctomycetota bacterium]
MTILHRITGCLLRAGLTWLGRRRLPQIDGTLNVPGLSASVEIIRDRWGVPHIYAANSHDLYFAQGFVHAQDRLWQMELGRRTATGRLSEVFGPLALDTDRLTRAFGFHRLAQADLASADAETRAVLAAYTQGINAFLQSPSRTMPVEFTLLGHRPEPWKPEESGAISRVMLWQLSHAWTSEIVRARLVAAVGAEHAAELEIHYPKGNPLTLPVGIEFNRLDLDGTLRQAPGPFLSRGKGSNAWVVAGRRTNTGKPMLANDMHLPLSLPSVWYENHLVSGEMYVTGVSIPGLPMVIVGHNARIAWGATLAYTDCEDLFVENFHAESPYRYEYLGEWREAQVIPEPIQVKGLAEPHVEHVVSTCHGPIISDVVGFPEQRIAVCSMALRPSAAIRAWLLLNRAGDWDSFVAAMRLINATQLNVVYADVDGSIGYWVTGSVPVRAKGDGTVPVPGWSGEYDWISEVPFHEMPHAFNPEQGYVVTCNHRIVPDDYPHFLGNVWMNGYRARRAVELIEGKPTLTLDDCRAMQLDVTCIPGREFVQRLARLRSTDPEVQAALECLRSWDGQLSIASVGGTVYEVTRYILVHNLLGPVLGRELTNQLMGQGFHPQLASDNEFYGHDTVALLGMLDNPNSRWVAQAGGREAVLTKSLKQAVAWLRDELGPDMAEWQWGKIHYAIFRHALGAKKPLDQVFSRGPLPIGGDTDTLCQTAIAPDDPYDNKAWSPTFRQIVDLGDLSRSLIIHPPGQSGQLGSAHYDDLAKLWLEGDYHPMLWTREQIERDAEGRLMLQP